MKSITIQDNSNVSILINPILTLISIFISISISISIFSDICWSYWGSYSSGPFYPRDRRDCFRMGPDFPTFGIRRHVRSNRQRCTYTTIFDIAILPSFYFLYFISFHSFFSISVSHSFSPSFLHSPLSHPLLLLSPSPSPFLFPPLFSLS